jgi:Mitochondrial 39-S ribosomal protein L47 (MRP-L47)
VAELRRKNFQDLHIIWYQCQRELNLLRTMDYNYKRWHIRHEDASREMKVKMLMVRDRIPRFLKQMILISLPVSEIMRTYQAGAE